MNSVLSHADLENRARAYENLQKPHIKHIAQALLQGIQTRKAADLANQENNPEATEKGTTRGIGTYRVESGPSQHNPLPTVGLVMANLQDIGPSEATGKRGSKALDQDQISPTQRTSRDFRGKASPCSRSPGLLPAQRPRTMPTKTAKGHAQQFNSRFARFRHGGKAPVDSSQAKLPDIVQAHSNSDVHEEHSDKSIHQASVSDEQEPVTDNAQIPPKQQYQKQDRLRAFIIQDGSAYSIPYTTGPGLDSRVMDAPQTSIKTDGTSNTTSSLDLNLSTTSRMVALLAPADRKALMDILFNADGSTAHSLVQLEKVEKPRRFKIWDKSNKPILAIVLRQGSNAQGHNDRRQSENSATASNPSSIYAEITSDGSDASKKAPNDESERIRIYTVNKHGGWREENLPHDEVLRRLARLDTQSPSALDKKLALPIEHRIWVNTIQEKVNEQETNQHDYCWTLRQLELKQRALGQLHRRWGILAVIVYLQRQQRMGSAFREIAQSQSRGLGSRPLPGHGQPWHHMMPAPPPQSVLWQAPRPPMGAPPPTMPGASASMPAPPAPRRAYDEVEEVVVIDEHSPPRRHLRPIRQPGPRNICLTVEDRKHHDWADEGSSEVLEVVATGSGSAITSSVSESPTSSRALTDEPRYQAKRSMSSSDKKDVWRLEQARRSKKLEDFQRKEEELLRGRMEYEEMQAWEERHSRTAHRREDVSGIGEPELPPASAEHMSREQVRERLQRESGQRDYEEAGGPSQKTVPSRATPMYGGASRVTNGDAFLDVRDGAEIRIPIAAPHRADSQSHLGNVESEDDSILDEETLKQLMAELTPGKDQPEERKEAEEN